MLTSNRFTKIPTKDCRERLEAVLTNERPIARGELHRGAVIAIQSALSDLNRGYLANAEIDGYYGLRTYEAVEAFQRDYGLIADGMVGRQTLTQLDSLYSEEIVRKSRGLSIHIGVDKFDPNHYKNATSLELCSCVNDARKMRDLAQSIGYDAVTLENEDATVTKFTGFMRNAIKDLFDGDALLVTFSGHGSQIANSSSDEEDDNLDETLLFYDRMLIDDEVYALLSQFRAGVRVHMVYDSCHSGTVTKALVEMNEEKSRHEEQIRTSLKEDSSATASGFSENALKSISADSISKALAGQKLKYASLPEPKKSEPKKGQVLRKGRKEANDDIVALFSDLYSDEIPTEKNKKQVDYWSMSEIIKDHQDLYDAIKNVIGNNENVQLLCSVVSLSACMDSQTTPAGKVYSYFTYNLVNAWGTDGFHDSYLKYHHALKSNSRPESTPVMNTYGPRSAEARLYDRPFMF